ncbi:hypothetical protein GOBAR_DD05236 [Gossypium barbadense]|nr:hypothetical protein GOBAR_DD05236 [Gossypium barbadense]
MTSRCQHVRPRRSNGRLQSRSSLLVSGLGPGLFCQAMAKQWPASSQAYVLALLSPLVADFRPSDVTRTIPGCQISTS